ncbi:GPI inositol-deacylase PGAP1-like protein [Gossypium australe]|uniref:GPI inositol-deacylase PGAP1-like protein n=1 Tax=Gossypium australe TaxID=47621 RepID=A0A5B6UHU8_9ROSI|nr:GPI inositol-deacylase PGAP1-like protein [Gossypium australe]
MSPPSLLGPPELRHPSPPKPETTVATTTTKVPSDPFMDLMLANFNKANNTPPMGFTENNSATYLATGNPCLDFFFHVVPNSPPDSIKEMLGRAWNFDPLMTLKLICNLRGVRGTGKSDKEGFYTAAFWLHDHHPKTLSCNLDSFVNFGYFKDLPEILYRMLEGSTVRQVQKHDWLMRKMGKFRGGSRCYSMKQKVEKSKPKEATNPNLEKAKARDLRREKKISMAKKVIERYSRDPDFRFLYERVSDLFAACLKSDMEFLKSNETRKIGLAAKWCPSIDSSFDKSTLLCESISKKIFSRENYPEYEGIDEEHYAYRVRDRLRKDVLVPLRKVLELPEVYIGANKWDTIPYNRVASIAMKFYKEKFLKHDKDRFSKYLEDVKAGKSTIAAGALLPHEIIAELNKADDEQVEQVAELQWQRMVNDLLQKGKLRNCMAVSDVSGSMHGIPMEVSVALGVLVSDLSEKPWKGKLITFSQSPKLKLVEGENLKEKTQFVRDMEWGGNTDFQKVFDLILKVAVEGNLKPEQIIKRLFVFSDMEFDQASMSPWETDYDVIVKKFTEKGYGDVIPQIVFWNLRHSRATPVPATQKGVALVSGFSKNLLKMFLDEDGDINPVAVMEAAISGEEYQKLVVLD